MRTFFLLISLALAASGAQSATLVGCDDLALESTSNEAIEVFAFGQASTSLTLRNVGDQPLQIQSIRPRRPPGRASAERPLLQPGESTVVHIQKPVDGSLGLTSFGFPVVLEVGPPARVCMLRVPVFTQSAYRPESPSLVRHGLEAGRRSTHQVEITTHEALALGLLEITGLPEWMQGTAVESTSPQTLTLEFAVLEGAPTGYHAFNAVIKTDLELQPYVAMQLQLGIYGDIVPARSRLDLGGAIIDEPFEVDLAFEHRRGEAFTIERITVDSEELVARSEECGGGCQMLTVQINRSRTGQFRGNVQVDFADGLGAIVIPITAMFTTAENPVINLGEVGGKIIRREVGGARQ